MMKTLYITIALLTALCMSMSLSASGLSYVYNVEKKGERISSQIIYKTDPSEMYLRPHLKYDFSYNEENHPTQKDVLQWDETTQKWEMIHRFCYHNEAGEYKIEYAEWDKEAGAFAEVSERTIYSYNILRKPTLYEVYKRDPKSRNLELTYSHSIQELSTVLYADK